jgi:predicted GIY-YIG superfamily endonuclease
VKFENNSDSEIDSNKYVYEYEKPPTPMADGTKFEMNTLIKNESNAKYKVKLEITNVTWYVYILGSINKHYKHSTYVGMTNNVKKRIRMHNKDISGGAQYTASKGPWEFLCHIGGFSDKQSTLAAEWRLKEVSRNMPQYRGPVGRLKSLFYCLTERKYWTRYSKT